MKRIFAFMMFMILGSICLQSVFSVGTAPLEEDVSSYYEFENLIESTNNGFDGTCTSCPSLVTGKINQGYDFDGTADLISMGDVLDIGNTDMSINVWIKTSSSGVTSYFINKWDNKGYYLSILNTGEFRGLIKSSNNQMATSSTTVNDGQWHMLTATFDRDSILKIFIDGVQDGSVSISSENNNIDTSSSFHVGSLTSSSGELDGVLDELSVYNKVLSQDEIDYLYQVNNPSELQQFPFHLPISPTPQINHDTQEFYNSSSILINLNTTTNSNYTIFLDGVNIANYTRINNTILTIPIVSEGAHSLLFESTDENGQVNSTANFTIDLTSPTSNNNIFGEYESYTFNFNSSCSDSNLNYCNITLNNQTLVLNSSSFTSTLNGNITYSINAADLAGNTFQENGTIFINPNQYFRIYDNARALNIENYSFGNYNSFGQYVIIPLYDLGIGTHSLQFSKFGYSQENFQFIFNSTSALNQTFNGTAVTITVKVYDESSPATQLNFNLSMNNILNYTQYLNQLNFQKYYNETLTGNLTFTAESSGFSLRKVFTELNPYSAVSHTIYLLADADSSPVVFRTLNLAQTQAIEDVVFTFKKEISGVPTFLGQAKTDSQGYTYFNMDILTDYEITISKSGYVSQVINSIPGKTDYTILMEEEGSISSFLFDDFSYIINPQLTPESLPFNASVIVFDEANLISSMKFTVLGENTFETQTLTAASGGTIQFEITNSSPQYVLNLTVMREGTEYNFIKKINYYVEPATNTTVKKVAAELAGEENNENRVFMILIIYVSAIVLGSLFSPSMGAIFGLLPITIFAFVDWITVGIAALFYVFTILGVLYFER